MEKLNYLTSVPYVEMRSSSSSRWSVLARLRPALIADLDCIIPFRRYFVLVTGKKLYVSLVCFTSTVHLILESSIEQELLLF